MLQAVQDIALHIVADQRLGEPSTNQQLFRLLQEAAWIDQPLADALRAAIGLRNVLVHGYTAVDLNIVRDVLAHHLGDVENSIPTHSARLGWHV